MNSSAKKYNDLRNNNKNSPIELKEKIRKDYKTKVQNCRDMLLNRFRNASGQGLRDSLADIYKHTFNFNNTPLENEEEMFFFEQVKNELVHEEFNWCLAEYEKSQLEVDWSQLEKEINVICPICQKNNFELHTNLLTCTHCKLSAVTTKSLMDIEKCIMLAIENHGYECTSEFDFAWLSELNENHIYLICNSCSAMQMIV